MMRLKLTFLLIFIAFSAAALAGNQDGAYDLSWFTIDGGGGTSTAGAFQLDGTIGQPDAGAPLTGGPYSLTGGFWAGSGPVIDSCPSDIAPLPNGDGMVNTADLLSVINAWGECAGCPADIAPLPNGDNIVNTADLLAVINGWGACP